MRRQPNPRGLTLIEVLVAMGLLALATLALVSANTFAARASSRSYRRYMAMRLAQQRIDVLTLGEQKARLPAEVDKRFPDTMPLDCAASGKPADLCSTDELKGWVDLYGRPCRRTGLVSDGYHPTCQYRRYIRYTKTSTPDSRGDLWRIFITVSHATDGTCGEYKTFSGYKEGDTQCIVTNVVLTR